MTTKTRNVLFFLIGLLAISSFFYLALKHPTKPLDLVEMDFNPEFVLTDQNGQSFAAQDLKNFYFLTFFGFTFCPDICPTELQKMALAFDQLPPNDQKKLKLLFITVDPDRDKPEVLKSYVGQFHPKLVGLTGDIGNINQIKRDFKVYAEKTSSKDTNYMFNHSSLLYLTAPNGKAMGVFRPDLSADDLAFNLKSLIR